MGTGQVTEHHGDERAMGRAGLDRPRQARKRISDDNLRRWRWRWHWHYIPSTH